MYVRSWCGGKGRGRVCCRKGGFCGEVDQGRRGLGCEVPVFVRGMDSEWRREGAEGELDGDVGGEDVRGEGFGERDCLGLVGTAPCRFECGKCGT